jgi:hypothetical protein
LKRLFPNVPSYFTRFRGDFHYRYFFGVEARYLDFLPTGLDVQVNASGTGVVKVLYNHGLDIVYI